MTALAPGLSPPRAATLRRRVRLVVAATIAYNAVEAVVALAAGAAASSSALLAFGLDSVVEVLSAAAIAWQFTAGGARHETRERAALRVVAASFFLLAAVVAVDAARALTGHDEPAPSAVGIALAAASLLVMPVLSTVERRTGRELGSASVVADSRQTLLCAALSAVLLVGLVLTGAFGWTWADPAAALVIAAVAVREGASALRGDTCCAPVAVLLAEPAAASARACADECCRP